LDKIKKYKNVSLLLDDSDGSNSISYVKLMQSHGLTKPKEKMGKEVKIQVKVVSDGPTRELRISDYTYKHRKEKSKEQQTPEYKQEEVKDTASMMIKLEMTHGIGISLVDHVPQELLYISFQDISLEYARSDLVEQEYFHFTIGRFQIDNQLFFAQFPIIACHHLELGDKKFFDLLALRGFSRDYQAIDYYTYVSFAVQELDINLDECFLLSLFRFVGHQTTTSTDLSSIDEILETQEGLLWPEPSTTDATKMMYFEFLCIHPIQFNISFSTSHDQEIGDDVENPLRVAFGAIGMKLPSIDGAPICLNSLILHNPFISKTELLHRISDHYWRQLLIQAYKILGSFEFLGNPVALFNNLGTGFKDFFYEPYLAAVNNPTQFKERLNKGAESLVKNSLYGVFNTVSKVTDSWAHGVAKLSMANDYQLERGQRARTERPKNVGEGIVCGVKDLGKGFVAGVAGVVVDPILGAKKEGGRGMVKGVAQGVVGVAVKPTVGMLDTVNKTSQGIKAQTDRWDRLHRQRIRIWPRHFGQDKVLRVYSEKNSMGQAILYSLADGKYLNEWYRFHEWLESDLFVNKLAILVTNKAVYLVQVDENHFNKQWRAPFAGLEKSDITETEEGIEIQIRRKKTISSTYFAAFPRKKLSTKNEGNKEPIVVTIPITDKTTKHLLHCAILQVFESEKNIVKWIELYDYKY